MLTANNVPKWPYKLYFFYSQGVKQVVGELERKKRLILSIVMKDHDKYLESSEAVNAFSENYNKVRVTNG